MENYPDFEMTEDGTYLSPLQTKLLTKLKEKPMIRAELVKEIESPRTTIYDNLMGLMAHNLVKKFSRPMNKRGRPLVFFKLIEDDKPN